MRASSTDEIFFPPLPPFKLPPLPPPLKLPPLPTTLKIYKNQLKIQNVFWGEGGFPRP